MADTKTCAACGAVVGAHHRTCTCGASLAAPESPYREPAPPPTAAAPGRKKLAFYAAVTCMVWAALCLVGALAGLPLLGGAAGFGALGAVLLIWRRSLSGQRRARRDHRLVQRSKPRSAVFWVVVVIASVLTLIPIGFVVFFLYAIANGALTPGRPLRVAGLRVVPRVLRGRRRTSTPPSPDEPRVTSLSPPLRRRLAKLWLADARAEHAAVAAFDRLAADLVDAGAPAPLVDGARRAVLEEQGHAVLCFTVAGAYLGRPVSASPLPAWLGVLRRIRARAPQPRSELLARLAVESLVDGCVEEGLAAKMARAGAAHAEDPAIAHVLDRIAREEASHAELAHAIVGWAARELPSLLPELRIALAREQRRPRRPTGSDDLLEHGRLDAARIGALVAEAHAEAVSYLQSLAGGRAA